MSKSLYTRSYYFDDELTAKSVSSFISEIEDTRPSTSVEQRSELVIYFSTQGGFVESSFALGMFLHNLTNLYDIRIVITGWCHSAGILMMVFLKDLGAKNIEFSVLRYSTSVLHAIGFSIHTRNDYAEIPKLNEEANERKNNVIKRFRKYLTKDEIKSFNAAGDVSLDSKRIAEILGANIIQTF